MRITNWTRGVVLADQAQVAGRFCERLRGFLGRAGLSPGEALILSPCTSIHSCFMRFSLDAAFIDRDGRVLHLIHAMRPFRLSRFVPRARSVIELSVGVLERSGTVQGDMLQIEA